MGRSYNVIDSDGHVLEPPNFWDDYIDPAYRDRVPELFTDTDGKERLRIEGRVYGGTQRDRLCRRDRRAAGRRLNRYQVHRRPQGRF